MKRSFLLALAVSLLAAVALVPAVLAADEPPPAEPTPAVEPTPTPDGNGEIVIDPTFISEPTPAATPRGEVRAATGRPDRTPPATDTVSARTAPGTGLQVLLLVAVAGCSLALLAARVPPGRRS